MKQVNNGDQLPQKFEGSGNTSAISSNKDNKLNERESPVSFGPTLPPDSTHKGLGERSEKVKVVFKRNIGKTKNISATMSETESDDKSEPNEPPVYEVRSIDRKKKKHRKHSRQEDEKRRGHKRKHRHKEDTPSQSDYSEEERRYKRRKDTKHKRKGKHRSPSSSSDSESDYSSSEYEYKRSHDTTSRSHDATSRSHDSKGHRRRSSGGTMEQDKSHSGELVDTCTCTCILYVIIRTREVQEIECLNFYGEVIVSFTRSVLCWWLRCDVGIVHVQYMC